MKNPPKFELPDEDPVNWDPEIIEQKLFIKDKEGLYNKLNELATNVIVENYANSIKDLIEKHFYFRGG